MHRPPLLCGYALALCTLLGMAACASMSPTAVAGERETEAAIVSKINAAIGEAPCTADAQCRTIGLGVSACGGPSAWRPWSTQTSGKREDLQNLAEQLATLQRRRQEQSGMVSTCRYIPDPGASCQAQRCVLKATADAAN